MRDFAVILTHNRPELLVETVAAIGPQVECVIVIDNASSPPVEFATLVEAGCGRSLEGGWRTMLVHVPDQPPNLSALWNRGIDLAQQLREASAVEGAYEQALVAVICDDAPPPAGWFAAVRDAMLTTGAAIGASSPWAASGYVVKTEPDRDLHGRMPGHAWILDVDRGVRADERFVWWYGDTKLDMDCRRAGGMVLVGGYPVPNRRPDDFITTKPELAAQAARDAQMYVDVVGPLPWP